MPNVGEQLAAAREAKEWSVEDIAHLTKLRGDHIRAVERGDYKVFSAPVYLRGCIKTYSKLVGLSPEAVLAVLDEELIKGKTFAAQRPLGGPRRGLIEWVAYYLSRVPWKIILPLGLLLLLAATVVVSMSTWQEYQRRDPLESLEAGVYPLSEPTPVEMLPLPSMPVPKGDAP